MKILVLSCNTGGGHNTAGNAVIEELKYRDSNIECKMVDALAFASKSFSKLICKSYISMARNIPKFYGKIYKAADYISSDKRKSFVYYVGLSYARRLGKYIVENNYDAVITTHVFASEALTFLKKHNKINVKTFAIATDYTCSPFWEETNMDYYFIPHADLIPEFLSKGMIKEKLIATGIPVSKRFTIKNDKTAARKHFGFADTDKIYLIMSGSMGAGKIEQLVSRLLSDNDERIKVLVICGNNKKLQNSLTTKFSHDLRLSPIGFTTEVDKYMEACDVLFTKPGGLTSTEAAVKTVPLVHTDPIPGCEDMNIKFFTENGMSIFYEDFDSMMHNAMKLANSEELKEKMMQAQAKTLSRDPAAEVCDFVLSHM